jgi:hypothetical protein
MKSCAPFDPPPCRTNADKMSKAQSPLIAKTARPAVPRRASSGHCRYRRLYSIRHSRLLPLPVMVRGPLSRSTWPDLRTNSLSPDRIPVPQISQATSSLNLTTSAERKSVRRSLEEISRNSAGHQPGPKSLQGVGRNVDMLLDGDALSELYVVSRMQGLQPIDLTIALHSSQYIQDPPFESPICALRHLSFGCIRPGA